MAKNKFDLRLEAFVYQPYEPFIRGEDNEPLRVAAFTKRYYLGSGSMIYQSPLGPVWFNLSYFDDLQGAVGLERELRLHPVQPKGAGSS